jgi:glycine betaine catabolism B
MLKKIDNLIDGITMYRVVLYYLMALIGLAAIIGLFGLLPYQPIPLIFSAVFLMVICWGTEKIFSSTFNTPYNIESPLITALILALIITPPANSQDVMFLFWAAVLAISSKFILAVKMKHIFNPAAIAVVLTSLVLNQNASWWVGNAYLMPFVVVGGLLIMRKTRREDMVFAFVITALLTMFASVVSKGTSLDTMLSQVLLHSSLFFFAFAMLTEPLTLPSSRRMQIVFAILVGILFAPDTHLGTFYFTPEIALCLGNLFAWIVSPKQKLLINLYDKIRIAPDAMDFIFRPREQLAFLPGQYMEWTLPHQDPDSRGNRRYFTIASSPTEREVRLGVKFYANGSSYKYALARLGRHTMIAGAGLSGEFTLPKDKDEKLVFVAGGIGITPFRSMIKYLMDTREWRDIILIYSNKTYEEIIYKDVFDDAEQILGIKVIYLLTDLDAVPKFWQGRTGRLNSELIAYEIPDFKDRKFYISGPHTMVAGVEDLLKKQLQLDNSQVITDFFPGF